jgi:hypothetical protein
VAKGEQQSIILSQRLLLSLNIGASDLHFCFHSSNNEDIQDNNGDDSDDDEDREVCCSYLSVGSIIQGVWAHFRKQTRPAPICQQSGRVGRPEITPSRVLSLPRYLRYFTYQLPRGRRIGMESMTADWLRRNPLMAPP